LICFKKTLKVIFLFFVLSFKVAYAEDILEELSKDKVYHNTINSFQVDNGNLKNSNNQQKKSKSEIKTINKDNTPKEAQLFFGENLFRNQCNNLPQIATYNPNYVISIGDKIAVNLWGAYSYSQVQSVDNHGNILIPNVGPVKVANYQNKDLNNLVANAVKTVFKNNVNAYANLLTAQPVQVFVSGYVANPGLYDGISSDSVLYYLCKAGGIIPNQGSFKAIDVIRNSKTIAKVDLYDFLLNGYIPYLQLHQGDSILVRPMGAKVSVQGDIRVPGFYEVGGSKDGMSLLQLLKISGVIPKATDVLILDNRGPSPKKSYISLNKIIESNKVYGGEEIYVSSDQDESQVRVNLKGSVIGPRQLILSKGTSLNAVVEKLKLNPEGNVGSLQLFRESVAVEQKNAIKASLDNLEKDAYTNSALTPEGIALQKQYAEMLTRFIERVKIIEPKGQVIVESPYVWPRIIMQNNDTINIPAYTSVVNITGEVIAPTASIVTSRKRTIRDYINEAGGYTSNAEQSYVILIMENGMVCKVKANTFIKDSVILEGAQIMIPPKTVSQSVTLASAVSRIIYQVAFAAKVVLSGL